MVKGWAWLLSLLIALTIQSGYAQTSSTVSQSVLRIAGWDVYSDPNKKNKTIGYQLFEDATGSQIAFTPLNNLDAIIEAAESGTNYDLFIISNEGVRILYEMQLIKPLELGKITNYDNLHPSLKYSSWCQFEAQVYAVPWAWGPTGLLYDADQVPEPSSWEILWSDEYRDKVAMWDDFSMIWTAALSLGYDNVYNLTKPQLEKVRDKLLALNQNIYGYYSGEQQEMDYIHNKEVVLLNSWFDPSRRLLKAGRNFKMVIPKEGAVGMFDSYMISHDSKNSDLAHQYINHQIAPGTQREMVRTTGLPPANIQTLKQLTHEEIKALHLDETDYFERMLLWDVMPRRHLYEQLMLEIRSDFAKRQRR